MLLRRMKWPTSQPILPDCQRPSYRYSDLLQTQGLTIYSNDSLMSNVYRWVNWSALKLRDVESQKVLYVYSGLFTTTWNLLRAGNNHE
jgi:hypothetical protein